MALSAARLLAGRQRRGGGKRGADRLAEATLAFLVCLIQPGKNPRRRSLLGPTPTPRFSRRSPRRAARAEDALDEARWGEIDQLRVVLTPMEARSAFRFVLWDGYSAHSSFMSSTSTPVARAHPASCRGPRQASHELAHREGDSYSAQIALRNALVHLRWPFGFWVVSAVCFRRSPPCGLRANGGSDQSVHDICRRPVASQHARRALFRRVRGAAGRAAPPTRRNTRFLVVRKRATTWTRHRRVHRTGGAKLARGGQLLLCAGCR